jgi:hypothetical protein
VMDSSISMARRALLPISLCQRGLPAIIEGHENN